MVKYNLGYSLKKGLRKIIIPTIITPNSNIFCIIMNILLDTNDYQNNCTFQKNDEKYPTHVDYLNKI
jgi:hypothetical protein